MMVSRLIKGMKYLVAGIVCLLIALFLLASLREVNTASQVEETLDSLPNYNYVPDIKSLKEEGKVSEALEMARFVTRHPDMPGQKEAIVLELELEKELTSLWGRTKRISKGFITGSGDSIEELAGGIASDMIIYGDIRDLIKQGYYKVTGKETDSFIAALAGIGLLTEVVDLTDWAPAVLKGFRKIGAVSRKFSDFVVSAAKKSVKGRKLDGALKTAFGNLRHLADKMGLARTATVFKHVDDPSDLTSLTEVARKNSDAVYYTVKNGGSEGISIIKRLGGTDDGIASLVKAAKKGPAGIQWLKRGGKGRKYIIRTRLGARILKNVRLQRPQRLITGLAKANPALRKALWACVGLLFLASIMAFLKAGSVFFRFRIPESDGRG